MSSEIVWVVAVLCLSVVFCVCISYAIHDIVSLGVYGIDHISDHFTICLKILEVHEEFSSPLTNAIVANVSAMDLHTQPDPLNATEVE